MDENQSSNSAIDQNAQDSFDILSSMASAADSIDANTFAFLVLPVGITVVAVLLLSIYLLVKRKQNRKNFERIIDDEIRSAESGPKSTSSDIATADLRESWTVPDSEDLRKTPPLAAADTEESIEPWQVPDSAVESEEPTDLDFADSSTAAALPAEVQEVKAQGTADWISRLRQGLSKTRDNLTKGFSTIFGSGQKLDAKMLEQLHEQLYRADIGVKTCDRLVKRVESELSGTDSITFEKVAETIRSEVSQILSAVHRPLSLPEKAPWVILVVGVNGVGKTTTIGKLTARFLSEGKTVLLAAADTFRAAAIEQLQTWGNRLGVEVIAHQAGADPAAVAFDAVKAAKARGHDILIIDTAGRLHSKKELMDELGKIHRVIGKDCPGAPHETWLVIDATTGQNANMQVAAFSEVVKLSGLVVTKLDGTAKGGVVIGIADQHQIPFRFIGVGEKASDLREFSADDFSRTLI